MFVVYSPEGQNAIGSSELKADLRVDPSTRVPSVNGSQSEESSLASGGRQATAPARSAIRQYQSVQTTQPKQPLVRVSEIMSAPIITVSSDTSLNAAWRVMSAQDINHLPVVNALGVLIGMVTASDILRRVIVGPSGVIEETRSETIAEVMQRKVITTHAGMDIRKVALVMTSYQSGSVVIVNEEGLPRGIVTLSDMVKRLSAEPPLTLYA